MPSGAYLIAIAGLHYAAVLWLVSESIKNYALDKYALPAALSMLLWIPVAICYL